MSMPSKSEQRDDRKCPSREAGRFQGPLFLALRAADFPAQALAAWDPSLRDRPFVVVDQDPESHKTAVLACSPAARALGIEAGLPYAAVRRRWRRVPALFRNGDWEKSLREELEALCLRITPEFEARGDGTALLDLTGTPALRAADPMSLARKLRQAALYRTGLTDVALGLAATRLMARVMARQAHPAGLLACPPGREAETLAPLDPGVLPGLSPQCRQRIRRYALASVGQIRALGRQALLAGFGDEGDKLYALASGMDPAPAPARRPEIAAETVLEEDANDDDFLARRLRATVDLLVFRLRREGAAADRLRISIRYSDHKISRKTLAVNPPTDGFRELSELSLRAFRALHLRRVALRSISLAVARPEEETGQLDLFEGEADRRQRAIAGALDRIRARSGFEAIAAAGGTSRFKG